MIIYTEATLNLIAQTKGSQFINQLIKNTKIKEIKNIKYIILN